MVLKDDRDREGGVTPAQQLQQQLEEAVEEELPKAKAAQEQKVKDGKKSLKSEVKDAKMTSKIQKTKADKKVQKSNPEEAEAPGKLSITVLNAVSGDTLGQYLMAPTDLVQDLKDKVQVQLSPSRPWSVNGKLLYQSEVLSEALMIKEIDFQQPPELLYLSQMPSVEDGMGDLHPRSELLLLPEVMQQVLDSCKLQAYQPDVQWVLGSVTTVQSQEEIEELWNQISEDEAMRCHDSRPREAATNRVRERWVQFREGHRGARRNGFYVMQCNFTKRVLEFKYTIYNNGSYVPVPDPPRGWFARNSLGDLDGRQSAPLLAPRRAPNRMLPVDCFQASVQQLALPCAILALKSEDFQVVEVLAADRLHGFGFRVGFDLILAVKSCKTLKSSLVGVYFHPLMTSEIFNISAMDAFAHDYFDGQLFDDLLHASVCENIHQVLVMWNIDLVQTLRWTLTPIPSALRSFRRQLAQQWFPDSDLRIQNFNQFLQQQLLVQPVLEPLLLELPKDVCANPSCLAGLDCWKHRHLFQVPIAMPCPGGDQCLKNAKRKRPCRRHHCRGQALPGTRLCDCVQLWVPTSPGTPWSLPKPKAKPKAKTKKNTHYADVPEDPKGGLDALYAFLSSVRTNPLPRG